MSTATPSALSWLWRIPACAAALLLGTMVGGALASALGLEMPASPLEVDPAHQAWMMIPAAITIALGLAVLAVGLAGRWWERWLVLAAFLFVAQGLANALEATLFTTLGGQAAMAPIKLVEGLIGGLAVALLFPAPAGDSLARRCLDYVSGWRPGRLLGRIVLAILAFPLVYFVFGMMVAPIVTPHYARLDYLTIPPISVILGAQVVRSFLFLLISLPILIGWRGSRKSLVLALGLGHFAIVALSGMFHAAFLPAVLRWTHGIEMLADSMVYAWALTWLLAPAREPTQAGADTGALAA